MRRQLGAVAGVRVVVTGMGPAAAARAAAAELAGDVHAVVVTGVAGGCDPGLAAGTVVIATGLCDGEGHPLEVRLAECAAGGAVRGMIASTAAVVDDPRARARLAGAGALAVETEAAGWAPACRAAAVPLAVVRAVLDTPERPLGAAAGLIADGSSRPSLRAVARLCARPGAWATLARLARTAPVAEANAARAAVAAARALTV